MAISSVMLVFLILGIGIFLPAKWQVQRSITVNASPESIYPLIANFKQGWSQWSTFDSEDPTTRYTYSGPEEGIGTFRSWVSKRMGTGTQKIVKADTNSGIEYLLKINNNQFKLTGVIAMQPEGNATKVTWTDSGDVGNNLLNRYFVLLIKWSVGKSFESSLAKLKLKAEAVAVKP